MKVLTLSPEAFAQACRRLEAMATPFAPTLVVGIASGGSRVAAEMFAGVPHVDVVCRRPSSSSKGDGGLVARLVRRLPRPVTNLLRIAESRILAAVGRKGRQVIVSPEAAEAIARTERLLIVDDAVDSGHSLRAVAARLADLSSTAYVRTAAITVTTSRPVADPDYALMRNHTLIRFPWAIDYE